MNRISRVLLLAAILPLCHLAAGQEAKANKNVKAKKIFVPPVYLGNSGYYEGPIPKPVFDSLLKQGLKSRDSLGNIYTIIGFDFSYAERNLYEDSVANLVVLTDFLSEYCQGDTIPADIANSHDDQLGIYERTKQGDTAYFDHIRLLTQPGNSMFKVRDTFPILGRGMKFVITK